MKAWQLTTGLAALAITAGQLPSGQLPSDEIADESPPVRARLDQVVGTAKHGFVGPEDDRAAIGLDPIAGAIRSNPFIQQCLIDAQQDRGALPGFDVRFRVLSNGRANTFSIVSPGTLQGSTLEACLTHAFAWTLFPPAHGNGVWVSYPFEF
jgi:hypothetical protein